MPDFDETQVKRDAAGKFSASAEKAQREAIVKHAEAKKRAPKEKAGAEAPKPKAPAQNELLKHMRETYGDEHFCSATTEEIAGSMGITPKVALSVLKKAEAAGKIIPLGKETVVRRGFNKGHRGFGYMRWELPKEVNIDD